MDVPDTKLAKIIYGAILVGLTAIPFLLFLAYTNLSATCSDPTLQESESKSNRSLIFKIILVLVLSSLAAQAMNHSYPISKFMA